MLTVTHDIRGLASRAERIVLLGDGQVQLDGPTSEVFARTEELQRWGVLAPPLARLQVVLLGQAMDVLLTARASGGRLTGGSLDVAAVPAGRGCRS